MVLSKHRKVPMPIFLVRSASKIPSFHTESPGSFRIGNESQANTGCQMGTLSCRSHYKRFTPVHVNLSQFGKSRVIALDCPNLTR